MSSIIPTHSHLISELASICTTPAYLYVGAFLAVIWFANWATQRPPTDPRAPPFVQDGHGLFAAWRFFSRRWDFYQAGTANRMRNFSFWIGKYPVVGLSGAAARKIFYEHKALSVNEGYSIFFGVMPSSKVTGKHGEDISTHTDYEPFLNKAVNKMYQRDKMRNYLPAIIEVIEQGYARLAEKPDRTINPFDDLYRLSYTLAMRVWGCAEICRDAKTLDRMFQTYEDFKFSFTPTLIVFPWLPTPALVRKFMYGARLWWTLKRTIGQRQKAGRREDDICQSMLDNGDSTGNIIGVILTLLFAGHAQLGSNAAWIATFLGSDRAWKLKARREVAEVANRHFPDPSMSLPEKLRALPLEAWEHEFKVLELCFRDSMRLNTTFACFRRNMSTEPIALGSDSRDVVPSGWYCTYHIADANLDPQLHPEPERWNPGRYLDDSGVEKAQQPEFIGFGAGRHPCIGMKFARVAQVVMAAFWVANFEFELVDKKGQLVTEQPRRDFNAVKESVPVEPVFLRY